MSDCEFLFLEGWKAGVKLTVNDNGLDLEAPAKPPTALLDKLREVKPEMLRFLSCWIETPYGQAKFWRFVGKNKNRCGVVLRHQPDRVTFIMCSELQVKPSLEDKTSAVQ